MQYCYEMGEFRNKYGNYYKPFAFIYNEMPDVVACCDVILSRAGANSIWEAAVLSKPSVLVPLCGSGTRGDQVDNAKFFEEKKAALVLLGEKADSENLKIELTKMLDISFRNEMEKNIKAMVGEKKSVNVIAQYILDQINL